MVGPSDPALWRSGDYSYSAALYVDSPPVVFRARVNMPSGVTYPLYQFAFDGVTAGAYTDIEPGMLMLIGTSAGADDLGRQYVRKAATSTVLYPGWTSRGRRDGEIDVINDAYITILDTYPVYSRLPRITDQGVIYKDYELVFASDGLNPPPVVNIGGGVGWIGQIEDGDTSVPLTLTCVPYVTDDGATISAYQWTIKDCTLTGGSLTGSSITIAIPRGRRWIKVVVTDSNGESSTRRMLIVAVNKRDAMLVNAYESVSQRISPKGQAFSATILQDLPASSYPDGSVVLFMEREVYAGTPGSLAGPAGFEHVKFAGYLQRDEADIQSERTGTTRETRIEAVDVAGRLAALPAFSQAVKRKDSPTKWTHMANLNVDRYLHYLLWVHCTALVVADFTWSGTGDTYPMKALGSNAGTFVAQLDVVAKSIAHEVTCDMRGRLAINPDPNLLDEAGVTAATAVTRTPDVILTLEETDWTAVQLSHERPPRAHWLRSYGLLASASKIRARHSIAPGRAPGQGEASPEQNQQIVVDQDELNAREGHRYARLNSTVGPITIELHHPGDAGIEPAFKKWVEFNLSTETAAQRGLTFTDARMLPIEVGITHRRERTGNLKRVQVRLEPETIGTPAETVSIVASTAVPGAVIYGTVSAYPMPVPYAPGPSGDQSLHLFKGVKNIAMVDNSGNLLITTTFNLVDPVWTRTLLSSLSVSGTPHGAACDAFSPLYLGTGSTVNLWLVTSTGVYLISDVFGTPSASLKRTITSGTNSRWRIDSPFDAAGRVAIAHDFRGSGVQVDTTVDTGANWTSVSSISGFGHSVSTGAEVVPEVFWSTRVSGLLYCSAPISAGGNYALYRSPNSGVNWSQVSGPIGAAPRSFRCIHVPWHDNLDQSLVFFEQSDSGGGNNSTTLQRANLNTSVVTDISPLIAGASYGPGSSWGMDSSTKNRLKLILCGQRDEWGVGFEGSAVFKSLDGGDSWQTIYNPGTGSPRYVSCHFGGGEDDNVAYFWGTSGAIGYSQDLVSIDDKSGNLASFSPGQILRIVGG